MHLRNTFTLPSFLAFLVTVGAPQRVLGADDKEACLSAADQGQSLRDDGKYSAAREQFVTCSRGVCPKLVHDQCLDWLRDLDESMPTVVFGAKDDKGADVQGAHVIADGTPVGNLDGKPVPLDPGPHDVRFERDNPSQSISVHVVLRAGEKARAVTAAFPAAEEPPEKPPEEPPPPASAPPAPPGETPETPEAAAVSPSFWNGRSITSGSLLAAGAASVGVGVYFGLHSQSEASQADRTAKALGYGECAPMRNPANAQCKTLGDTRDAQNRDAVLNIVFYAAGGALAAGAVATWLLWPKPAGVPKANTAWVAPIVGVSRAGLSLGGTF